MEKNESDFVYTIHRTTPEERAKKSSRPILVNTLNITDISSESYSIKKIRLSDAKPGITTFKGNEDGLRKAREECKKDMKIRQNEIREKYGSGNIFRRLRNSLPSFLKRNRGDTLSNLVYGRRLLQDYEENSVKNIDPEKEAEKIEVDSYDYNSSKYKEVNLKNKHKRYGISTKDSSIEEEYYLDKKVAGVYYSVSKNKDGGYDVNEHIGNYQEAKLVKEYKKENNRELFKEKKSAYDNVAQRYSKDRLNLDKATLRMEREEPNTILQRRSKKTQQDIRSNRLESYMLEIAEQQAIDMGKNRNIDTSEALPNNFKKAPDKIRTVKPLEQKELYLSEAGDAMVVQAKIIGTSNRKNKEKSNLLYELTNVHGEVVDYVTVGEENGKTTIKMSNDKGYGSKGIHFSIDEAIENSVELQKQKDNIEQISKKYNKKVEYKM